MLVAVVVVAIRFLGLLLGAQVAAEMVARETILPPLKLARLTRAAAAAAAGVFRLLPIRVLLAVQVLLFFLFQLSFILEPQQERQP